MNKKQMRRNELINLLEERKFISIVEASNHFNVTTETIRQDIHFLEKKELVIKVHGGVRINDIPQIDSISTRLEKNYLKKMAICKAALELIDPAVRTIIGLDRGTTMQLFANQLSYQQGNLIVSNSLPIMSELKTSKNDLFCIGGFYSKSEQAFFSAGFEEFKNLQLDILFLGSSGVLGRNGICSSNFPDQEYKEQLITISRKKIVLIDSSKFTKTSFIEVVPWDRMDLVITDSGIPADDLKKLSTFVEVNVVEA